jgi:hypothetical protein
MILMIYVSDSINYKYYRIFIYWSKIRAKMKKLIMSII